MRPVRLLLSARDPGAAAHIREVALAASARADIVPVIAASGAAYPILVAAGLAPIEVPVQVGDAWLQRAAEVIAQWDPQAILVGASGPDCGLDEALVACAGGRPSYLLQEFWGDLNPGWNRTADTVFVVDEDAALATARRTKARLVVVGNGKYTAYDALDPVALKRDARARLGIVPGRLVVGYYGQGGLDWPGYGAMVARLAEAIAEAIPDALVVLRPHPKESEAVRRASQATFAACGLNSVADPAPTIEESLCACDVVCTSFSTCAVDFYYLSRRAPHPLGSVVQLLYQEDWMEAYRRYTGLPDVPLAGLGLPVGDASQLASVLERAARPDIREKLWQGVRTKLPPPSQAARVILDTIVDDIGTRDGLVSD